MNINKFIYAINKTNIKLNKNKNKRQNYNTLKLHTNKFS